MAEDPIHRDLLAIHSRLGVIEGKVNLLTRAGRDAHMELLKETVTKQPIVGQIYLLLDGKRSQREIFKVLGESGISTSEMTVSRRLEDMESEHGMTKLVKGGRSNIYAREPEMARLLNLVKKVTTWLQAAGETVPVKLKRRRRPKSK